MQFSHSSTFIYANVDKGLVLLGIISIKNMLIYVAILGFSVYNANEDLLLMINIVSRDKTKTNVKEYIRLLMFIPNGCSPLLGKEF